MIYQENQSQYEEFLRQLQISKSRSKWVTQELCKCDQNIIYLISRSLRRINYASEALIESSFKIYQKVKINSIEFAHDLIAQQPVIINYRIKKKNGFQVKFKRTQKVKQYNKPNVKIYLYKTQVFTQSEDLQLINSYSKSIFKFAPTPFVFQTCLSPLSPVLDIECKSPLSPLTVQEVSKDVIQRVKDLKKSNPKQSISQEEIYMREQFICHKIPKLQLTSNLKLRRKTSEQQQIQSCSLISNLDTCQSANISPYKSEFKQFFLNDQTSDEQQIINTSSDKEAINEKEGCKPSII